MSGFTENFRDLANFIGLPSRVLAFDFPRSCAPKHFIAGRDTLPTGYFITIGACINGAIQSTLRDILDGFNQGNKYVRKGGYIIFPISDINKFGAEGVAVVSRYLKMAIKKQLRPVVYTAFPNEFLRATQLSTNEVVMLPYDNQVSYHGLDNYVRMLKIVDEKLMPPANYALNVTELNALLQGAQVHSIDKMDASANYLHILDIAALLMLLAAVYLLHRSAKQTTKPKME